ncbi:MAG: hypothetical protein AB7E32_17275 [Desulfovibrio sp.]
MSETALVSMAEICMYVRRSDATVLKLIQDEGFPAKKIGGIRESDKLLVDEWRVQVLRRSRVKGAN